MVQIFFVKGSKVRSLKSNNIAIQKLLTNEDIANIRIQAGQLLSSSNSQHPLNSHQAGWLSTNTLGSGMDYAESRVYQQGDDLRNINWRLSARSTQTFVKTYHMESRPKLCIVLDQRRQMIFGTKKRLKITQALRLACLLIFVAEQYQLSVDICLINSDIQWLEDQDIESFLQVTNHAHLPEAPQNQATLQTAFTRLKQQLSEGDFIYLISDFVDINEQDKKPLVQLQAQYFMQALHIVDSAEQALPKNLGQLSFQAMNKEEAIISLNLNKQNQREAINKKMAQHLENIETMFIQSAIHYAKIMTDEDDIYSALLLPLE